MNSKKLLGFTAALIALAACVILYLVRDAAQVTGDRAPSPVKTAVDAQPKAISPIAYSNLIAKAKGAPKPKPLAKQKSRPLIDFHDITEEDFKLIEDIRKLAAEEDRDGLLALAEKLRVYPESDVREEYLKALGDLGTVALPEMTGFVDDTDEKVSTEARAQWLNAMYQIENQVEKANVICMAMSGIKSREFVNQLGDELRGLDEKLVKEAVEIVLESGNQSGIAVAKEIAESFSED